MIDEGQAEEEPRRDWTRAGGVFVGLAGVIHVVLGISAISGTSALEEIVRQIESNPDYGRLYFSLPVWGGIMLVLGLAELAAAAAASRRTEAGWLFALLIAFFGLTLSFFSLAIFRVADLVAIALLLVASFLLAYHGRKVARWP